WRAEAASAAKSSRTTSSARTLRTARAIGRILTAIPTGRTLARLAAGLTAWTATTTRTAASARPPLGGHRDLIIKLGRSRDQQTFFAITGNDDFPVLAAFERRVETIETQLSFRSFLPMTTKARSLQQGLNII